MKIFLKKTDNQASHDGTPIRPTVYYHSSHWLEVNLVESPNYYSMYKFNSDKRSRPYLEIATYSLLLTVFALSFCVIKFTVYESEENTSLGLNYEKPLILLKIYVKLFYWVVKFNVCDIFNLVWSKLCFVLAVFMFLLKAHVEIINFMSICCAITEWICENSAEPRKELFHHITSCRTKVTVKC